MIYYAQFLKDGTIYNNKNVYIKYYTEEQFAPYKSTANLIGSISLKPEIVGTNQDSLIIQTQTNKNQFKLKPLNKKDKIIGYIYVGDNTFVRIVKPSNNKLLFIIPIVICIITIICGGIVLVLNQKETPIEHIPTEVEFTSNENTEIPLYVNFNLSNKNNKINLYNPSVNTVNFVYEIYNNETLLYKTNEISPGKQDTIDMYAILGKEGVYNLTFKIRCFLNGKEVNGTEEPVEILIR